MKQKHFQKRKRSQRQSNESKKDKMKKDIKVSSAAGLILVVRKYISAILSLNISDSVLESATTVLESAILSSIR
jgi:DNA-binding protein YbaB